PSEGRAINKLVNIELGNLKAPQLYNLNNDRGEKNNLANRYPEKVKELQEMLEKIKKQ
ncbi:MAG TPA: arylsulfatase, partial [Niabella sp.]|nr:arylsulfatase [Niabella sp.]